MEDAVFLQMYPFLCPTESCCRAFPSVGDLANLPAVKHQASLAREEV